MTARRAGERTGMHAERPKTGHTAISGLKVVCDTPLGIQTIVLPMFPDPKLARALSPNGRVHWGARASAKAKVAGRVALAALLQKLEPVDVPVRIVFRWVFPRGGRHDVDNLIGSGVTKAAIDSLVNAGYLADDSSQYVVSVAAEVQVERGQRRLEIRLEPAA